jgi:hypothetical protein
MGEKVLVDSQIADSVELIKHLDSTGSPPSAAFWYYYEDADDWRLVLAGESLDQHLQKNEHVAYKLIAEAISTKEIVSISVSDIKLMQRADPLVKTLRFLMNTGPAGIARAHLTNTTINGIFIQEILILRSS